MYLRALLFLVFIANCNSQIVIDENGNLLIQPTGNGSVSVPRSDLQIDGVSMTTMLEKYPASLRAAEHLQILKLDTRRVQSLIANSTYQYTASAFINVGSDTYLAAGSSSQQARIYKWDGVSSFTNVLSVSTFVFSVSKVETFAISGTSFIFFGVNAGISARSTLYRFDTGSQQWVNHQEFFHFNTTISVVGAQFVTTNTKSYLVVTANSLTYETRAFLWNGTHFSIQSPLVLSTGSPSVYTSRCFKRGGNYCMIASNNGIFLFAYDENTNQFVYNNTFGLAAVKGIDVVTFNSQTFISASRDGNTTNIYLFDNIALTASSFQSNLTILTGAGTLFFSFDTKLYLLFADGSSSGSGQPLYRLNSRMNAFELISYVSVYQGSVWSYGTINKIGYLYLAAQKPTYLFKLICENSGCV